VHLVVGVAVVFGRILGHHTGDPSGG
jgi:hypothetical protein